jgi:hypothetical protein
MGFPSSSDDLPPARSVRSPEAALLLAERHLDAGDVWQALPHLETGARMMRDWVQAARIDAAGTDSYAHEELRNRLSALHGRTTSLIARLEAARREVEDELTAVRSQKAFERQETNDQSWFESRA